MKQISMAGAALLMAAASGWSQQQVKPVDWKGYTRGVKWEKSLDEAKTRAVREKKPILLYQLVGDLNKEGC
ncbi:MAG TPA: hypothetical protein VEN81_12465 [Planctomycetota bacterium]|nr:hypothetical protein [Planctomycetota bacterium]